MIRSSGADRKRKRSASVASFSSLPRLLPEDSINPLSHAPNTLRQFAAAGLAETEPLPSVLVPGFPHRPLPRTAAAPGDRDSDAEDDEEQGDDDDDDDGAAAASAAATDTDAEEDAAAVRRRAEKRARGLERERRLHEREVGVVAAIMRRCLEAGDMGRAKLAFGRLLRSVVHGKKVDLRHGGYWAMGAEILMRDGEVGGGARNVEDEEEEGAAPRRWGSAANIVKVKTYFEDLIQLHPYDRHHPGSISALDFWPVMLSCEMYNVYIEHKLALKRLESGDYELGGMEVDEEPLKYLDSDEQLEGGGELLGNAQTEAAREAKNRLRLQALEGMRDIANRMDAVMDNPPYTTSPEMLRLRGMAALYMGDLAVPPHPRTAEEDDDGKARRTEETDRAKTLFRKLLQRGGEIEPWFRHIVQSGGVKDESDEEEGEDEEEAKEHGAGLLPMYSSLPIRPP